MALSTGAKVGIGIGVVIGLVALGLLIWFVIWPAIAKAIGKGQKFTYNGGGSGNNNYIRNWIDSHVLSCSESPNMCYYGDTEDKCPLSAGFARLITQDKQYILSYNSKGSVFLSSVNDSTASSANNIWYLCFRNKNSGNTAYSGKLVAANQLCNDGKNMCNLFWECDSTQGVMPCSKLTNYKNTGNYPPDSVKIDTACSVKDCNLSYNQCTNKTDKSGDKLTCLESSGKVEPVEETVYVNSDDTISTIPQLSKSYIHHNKCSDGGKGCMNDLYYLGIKLSDYSITPTLVSNLGVRLNIIDCKAVQVDGVWTCA
ncbi:hypothetical protein DRO61_05105 [Candidatus Bathyarchaeota archaeon]|nr:MAG: hypothetical protein DRO61_05105 [Candidatus Bathyarchaeota archaeon]